MPSSNDLKEEQKLQIVETVFQETMSELKALHNEKLELIKRFRAENNLKELNKVRETLKR